MPSGPKPNLTVTPRPGSRTHVAKVAEKPGWQHGRRPAPPPLLTDIGKDAWKTWLSSWWAFFYTPDDLPGLRLAVQLYDQAYSGHVDASKAIPLMDRYGITPKGRQDLRWVQAAPETKPAPGPTEADEIAARRARRAATAS